MHRVSVKEINANLTEDCALSAICKSSFDKTPPRAIQCLESIQLADVFERTCVPELMEGSERNDKHTLTWYSCGPTVYDDAHLGHARTYVCTDIIRRILHTTFNVNTNFVMGVTDVDDKIIKRSQEVPFQQQQLNVSNGFLDLARRFENEFFDDLDSLNVLRPTTVTRSVSTFQI